MPEMPDKKLARLNVDISGELKDQLVLSSDLDLSIKLIKKYPTQAKLIISTILSTQKEAKKKAGHEIGEFSEEHFDKIFNLLSEGKIAKEAILEILVQVALGKKVSEAAKKFELLSTAELKKEIASLKKENKSAPEGKLKGIIIGKLRGRAKVEDIIRNI